MDRGVAHAMTLSDGRHLDMPELLTKGEQRRLPKLDTRVRFPSLAPTRSRRSAGVSASLPTRRGAPSTGPVPTMCPIRFGPGISARAPLTQHVVQRRRDPHASLVLAALDLVQVQATDAVLIGDSVTDIEVAHATRTQAIGHAKTTARGHELEAAGADTVVSSMHISGR
jgi:hypothetical protein